MRFVKFLLVLAVTTAITILLNTPLAVGPSTLPPVGKFMNPFSGFWQNAEAKDGIAQKEVDLPQLEDEVTVVYDDRLVPHIFAPNLKEALFVQGYIIAQHRLWQLDISTRAASGRLAEIMGPGLLNRDKMQRRRGMVYAAYNALKGWKKYPEVYGLLQAYTAGINARINSLTPGEYPLEFKLLNYTPEPWTELKTALMVKSMAATLCAREDDLESTNALEVLGPETFDFLFPEYNPKQSPVIPSDVKWDFTPIDLPAQEQTAPTMIGTIPGRPFEKPSEFLGSNNWAVAGSKTQSGNPILCNDPHLNLTLPAIWFELQLHTPQLNAYGVTIPGMPGVIIGFNENVAWGMTNVGQDVMDWYRIQWSDGKKEYYLMDGTPQKVDIKIERFGVKGGEDVLDTVKYTKWGPIVYEAEGPYHDMALRWLPHDVPNTDEISFFLKMNTAKNYDDYSEALKNYISPAQNFVFASREGDIAIKVNGKFPIKSREQGRFVQDGSKSSNSWKGFIPMEQVPQVKNPSRGFVSSANQNSTAPDYPYYYNGYFDDYRGRILNRKLSEMEKITVEDMMRLQNNNYSIKAEESLPLFLKYLNKTDFNGKESGMVKVLKEWDFQFDKDKAAPIFFELWWEAFYKLTWDEIFAQNEEHPMLFPEAWRTIALLETDPENPFFDDATTMDKKETAREIVTRAFNEMIKKVEAYEAEGKALTWESYRNLTIQHLGRIPAFASGFISSGGSADALNALRGSSGPSWRMVVELGREIKAYGVYPGGQSGNPGSPFFNNMVEDWASGNYNELLFLKSPEGAGDKTMMVQKFN